MIDWNYQPEGPFEVWVGNYDVNDKSHVITREPFITLDVAIMAFRLCLPPNERHWSAITDSGQGRPILTWAYHDGGPLHWRGCKAAFDSLAEIWDSQTDIAWWATMAENIDAFDDVEA